MLNLSENLIRFRKEQKDKSDRLLYRNRTVSSDEDSGYDRKNGNSKECIL